MIAPSATSAESPSRDLFGDYRAPEGLYDELVAPGGALREHARAFAGSLNSLGRAEFATRWENARAFIRENGVTYNVYGDPRGHERPWDLDALPLILPSDEWAGLEAGLIQRARLLNAVLADLYGPRRLIAEGLLPPSLVQANPAFLRACQGLPVPRDVYIHLHAVDLARTPDGRWWALADRTQAPSGAGYALENRIVLSRTLPEAFRDCQVRRLAGFFQLHREALHALAPAHRENPRVVLLTPGPYNETYFEHAYLARYLGLTLVEGGDLAVRDRRLFIKTLDGLQPVDVVFRRLDDDYCDPLELRADSFLGVAGLVDAVRAGNVVVANSLGSGLAETPALLAFLPVLCRHLLGEELRLPSLATWWCGQEAERRHVLANLDRMVVKPVFAPRREEPVFGRRLDAEGLRKLAQRIEARPLDHVAQEETALSTAPSWPGAAPEPRPVVLRAYITATVDGFAVMPGGLTRVSTSADTRVVSMQRGGGSKDTWVLSDGPVEPVTLLAPPNAPLKIQRATPGLPSRVADNLFWLGRYAERCEDMMRLLAQFGALLADETAAPDAPGVSALRRTLAELALLPPRLAEAGVTTRELEEELIAILFRQHQPGGLRDGLQSLRRTAAAARDRLSSDTWRILNQIHQDLRQRSSRMPLGLSLELLQRAITDLAAFSGMEMENMTRGHGWRFLDIGRRIERAIHLTSLLHAACRQPVAGPELPDTLLHIADSAMSYRRRYFAQAQWAPVLDMLLADDTNPRSLAFQLILLAEHLAHLPRDPAASPAADERLVQGLTRRVQEADVTVLAAARDDGDPAPLSAFLEGLRDGFCELSNTLSAIYFSHARPRVS